MTPAPSFPPEGSVMGIAPREALSLRVTEGPHGWYAVAYTGDGSKHGSVVEGGGSFATAEAAFAYLLNGTKGERLASDEAELDYAEMLA